MGHTIDIATWKRREHFELFRRAQQPFFSVTVEVDVTELWAYCARSAETSFFLSAIYFVLRAVNATEALRLRLRGNEVWLHDRVGLGTPIMHADETFGFARFDLAESFAAFHDAASATVARVKSGHELDPRSDEDDLVYHSTLPWLRFTSFTNALYEHSSIPRLAFGKVVSVGERRVMPVAVEVHHALVDGLDVGRLIERFEKELTGYAEAIGG